MKMVLGEVGKGLGSGRLRALLGGKGVSTFGKKVGGGLVMKFGSPWSMKLAGRLWSRYKVRLRLPLHLPSTDRF